MCKNSNNQNILTSAVPFTKLPSNLYRRKLAIKMKESLESDPITESDFKFFNSILEL